MDNYEFFVELPFHTKRAQVVPAYVQFDSANERSKDSIYIDKRNFDGYESFLEKLINDYNVHNQYFKELIYQILEETMDIKYVAENYEVLKKLRPVRSDITNTEQLGDYWLRHIVNMTPAQYEVLDWVIRIEEIGDYVSTAYGLFVNEHGLYYLPNYVNNPNYSVEDWRIKK